ncbi:hypothetical protein ACHAWX_003736 [Stephanocyclus meneghinianus]
MNPSNPPMTPFRYSLYPDASVTVTAFHSNPIGGHFNAYLTFSRIRLRFFWPKIYHYIGDLSSELVYNVPATEPMSVMHIDCYHAGHLRTYDNVTCYIVGACNMTAFGLLEGVMEPNSSTYTTTVMHFQLRHGFFHTMILGKDSKFYATFRDTARLLKLKTHSLSCANHNPMLVECIGCYLNKSLKIFNSEHRSKPRVAHEGLHMAMYAWNRPSVAGSDISRCLMVTGRKWHFPLDYSTSAHLELISQPKLVNSFVQQQAIILEASRKIGRILIDEHRAYHREVLNSLCPDPKLFEPGDYVFARRTVQSSAKHVRFGKLELACTGPWKIHKFHASHLSLVPHELIPFAPLDGPNHRFGQIHRHLHDGAYKAAGLKGFLPYKPFRSFQKFIPFFPSDTISFVVTSPSTSQLAASIIKSTSCLFFILWQLPSIPHREWHLICVKLPSSLSLHPHCLFDGRYLTQFFICHPKDKLQHPHNQCWWLEYHAASTVACLHQRDYHILRPDSYAPFYAKKLNLHPYCQWVNLQNPGTYIHGSFEFSTINGCKTRDCTSLTDWDLLSWSSDQYDNNPPDLDCWDFTGIQFSCSYHMIISDPTVRNHVSTMHLLLLELPFPFLTGSNHHSTHSFFLLVESKGPYLAVFSYSPCFPSLLLLIPEEGFCMVLLYLITNLLTYFGFEV